MSVLGGTKGMNWRAALAGGIAAAALLAVLPCSAAGAVVGRLALASGGALPAEGLAPELVAALVPEGCRVTRGEETLLELWAAKSLPRREGAVPERLGVLHGSLIEGGLVGVLRLTEDWSDNRGKPVRAGLYTLRYAVQPTDGNHLGASALRDFLVLSPAAEDTTLAGPADAAGLLAASRKASGSNHPAVLALAPPAAASADGPAAPSLAAHDEGFGEVWTLTFEQDGLRLGLIVAGLAEGATD